jgi:hypothetical protein
MRERGRLAEAPQFTFPPEVREDISSDQYKVHQDYWKQLDSMRLKVNLAGFASIMMGGAETTPEPPMPRAPLRLFRILESYAGALFDCESKRYPRGHPSLSELHGNLASRTEELVMQNITQIEKRHSGLTYHASYDQMRISVRESLQKHLDSLPKPIAMIEAPAAQPKQKPKTPHGNTTAATPKSIIDAFCDREPCSLEILAEKAEIARRQVFKIRNNQGVRRDARAKLAKLLGVEPDALKPR